jgi:hypothetical protein
MFLPKSFDFRAKWLYVIGMDNNYDCPTTINLDVLKIVLDATTPSNLARIHAQGTAPRTHTALTKDQAGDARRNQACWQAHTTGNAYMLQVQNRTCSHSFRVQSYGKNVWQAVLRYYKGLDNNPATWQATKVVSATKI